MGFRDIEAGLSCILGFGSDAWDRLFGTPRPAELHPFREINAGPRHAVATPGDMLFHIRAKRFDLCFELATQIMARLKDAVSPSTRYTALDILMIVIWSDLSTARKIRRIKPHSTPHS